ncbi:MAG: hypothetical protein LBE12_06205 [Planctomycetaceae bacterium]|nr:hypothetical protein [Planctomycetaceae bacterium]
MRTLSALNSPLSTTVSGLDFKGQTIRRALPYVIADCPYEADWYTIF